MLSLCTIAKNEEVSLHDCLASVRDVVDEMVVLDTGSTDRTPEIARAFGATVHYFPWGDDFAAARNQALSYVSGDWVLVLDADEVLSPDIIPMLKQAIQDPNCLLINLVRQEVGAMQSPYSLVSRLFRRHPDIRFEHPYHAMVDDSVGAIVQRETHWQVGCLTPVAIWHSGYQPSAIASRDKLQTAQRIMEKYLAQHPGDSYTASKLGALLVEQGEISRGIQLMEFALSLGKPELPVCYELHYHLGIAWNRSGKISKAKHHYQEAIAIDILPILKLGAAINLGNLLLQTGDISGAITTYQSVLQIDPNLATAHYNLGLAQREKGRIPEAIAAYRRAIELQPDYPEAYQNLGVALLKGGNIFDAKDAFRQAIFLYQRRQSPAAAQLLQKLTDMGFNMND
ncbi:MAG TPA: tetratricopeptide repeat protein [Oscillatoriaceae cyanobacterium M33_DOE_052]|uniref:Tetratricopeptide repeat protein n=1 Tax=Planktothricoides sp. SpSt-374 TaxID=2282167 RepID=A0A7C3VL97_9CYAN|nr:tetratricopeptide repeat protein [Oscillatoriaceae cyanobacterium M33_DOE_052]